MKRLISSCYKNQEVDFFSRHDTDKAIYLEYEGDKNDNRIPDLDEIGIKNFEGDGDFRSDECIKLLKQADIVVTNPPFSLFREYLNQLMKHKKKFLIIGNINTLATKSLWPYVKKGQVWLGPSISGGDREFGVPDDYPLEAEGCRIDENGNKYIRVKSVRWCTNLDHASRHKEIILHKRYSPDQYPDYDNYRAINVKEVKDIPVDYEGAMGVPITFLDKYNPSQFEIIGLDSEVKWGAIPEYARPEWQGKLDRAYLNGKRLFSRMLIRRRL